MNRPKHFDQYLKRYNYIKDHLNECITIEDKAIILVVENQLALEKGNKYFHPETNEPLTDLNAILVTLNLYGEVCIELSNNEKGD